MHYSAYGKNLNYFGCDGYDVLFTKCNLHKSNCTTL